ncbi:MAG: ATP-binding protein [Faecalibacillus sp.]
MTSLKQYKSLYLFFLSQMILLIIFISSIFMNSSIYNIFSCIVIVILCLIAFYSLYSTYKNMIIHAEIVAKNEMIENQQKIQIEHYLAVKKQLKEIDKIKELIDQESVYKELKNTEEMNEYVNQLIKKYITYTTDYCDNKMIDAIIFNKIPLCEQNHIQHTIQMIIPKSLDIDNIDLISVFINMIDNAIEACLKVDKNQRFINIDAKIQANYLIIKITNSKSKDIIVTLNQQSTKSNQNNEHGYGLQIIKKTCQKNHGDLTITNKENIVEITATLKV